MENKSQHKTIEQVQSEMQKQVKSFAGNFLDGLLLHIDEVDIDTAKAILEGTIESINESRKKRIADGKVEIDLPIGDLYERRLIMEKLNSLRITALQRDIKVILEHLKH